MVQKGKGVIQGSFLVISGTFTRLALTFLTHILFARLLGPDQYGILVLGFTVVNVSLIVTKLGLTEGLPRFIPRTDSTEERSELFQSATVLVAVSSLLVGASLFLASGYVASTVYGESELEFVLQLFALLIPVLTLHSIIISTFRGHERVVERVLIDDIGYPLLSLVLVSVPLILGWKLFGATVGWVASGFLALLLSAWMLRRRTSITLSTDVNPQYRLLLAFSLPLLVSSAMEVLLRNADYLLVGFFLGPEDVSVYRVAYSLANLVTIPMAAFAFLFMPAMSDLDARDEAGRIRPLYRSVTRWSALITLPIFGVLVLFPEFVIGFFYGTAYTAGDLSLLVIAGGFLFHLVVGPVGQPLISMGRTRVVMAGHVLNTTLNVVLNVLLIPRFGIIGAAVASTVSYVFINSSFSLVLYTWTRIHPFSKEFVAFVVSTLATYTGIHYALSRLVGVGFVGVAIHGVTFGLCTLILFIVINESRTEDIEVIRDTLHRLR